MQLGNWQLDIISGGTLRFDGGNIFGVVPKPLWERVLPADDLNRVPLDTNCLLARDGKHTVLIDTGYGTKVSPKMQEIYCMDDLGALETGLAKHQLTFSDIDTVILTHLHFDHVGGATRYCEQKNKIVPTFPNAKYVIDQLEWQDATSNIPELQGAYPKDNFQVLAEENVIRFLDDDQEIVPGIRSIRTSGHTQGHRSILIESNQQTAIYLADICPTTHHLPRFWCLAYDLLPLKTRQEKPRLLKQAAENDWLVLFNHDPKTVAGYVQQTMEGTFAISESFTVEDFSKISVI